MLRYLMISETENEIKYRYYPEDGKESGIVSVNKKTGECSVDEAAYNDRHQRYAMKLLKKMKEFVTDNSFEKNGIVAWS